MRNSSRVYDFLPKDRYTNLTLAHSNISLKVKPTLVLKSGERERERVYVTQKKKSEKLGKFWSAKRRKKNEKMLLDLRPCLAHTKE